MTDKPDETIETLAEVIEPIRPKSTAVAFPTNDPEDDYEFARQKIREAINYGKTSIEELANLCADSKHPRAFEVLADTIKTVVDASKTLMDTKETSVQITKAQGNLDDGTKTINNNLFVGSTAELQRMVEEFRKKNEND
jgi:hypothetical protein